MTFEIGELNPNSPHLFADLAELLVMIGYNGANSLHKNDLLSVRERGMISTDEVDEESEETSLAHVARIGAAALADRSEMQLEDAWTQLTYRSRALSQFYPFEIDGDQLTLIDELTIKHRTYAFLLACSRLRSFKRTKGAAQRWARCFASLCQVSLRGLLPSYADVRVFDANSDDRRSYYSTDLRQALRVLGKDIGVMGINEAACNSAGSSGDAGLDLVGSINLDDGASVNFSILAQCGAQESGWPRKTLEAHSMRYRHYFQMQMDYPGVMFTPVCYRKANGTWVDDQSTNGIFLADRGRILNLIEKQDSWSGLEKQAWFDTFETEFRSIIPPD